MSVREHLRRAVEGIPEGGAVMLPVEAVRRWLREDVEEQGEFPAPQEVYSTAEAAEIVGVSPPTVAEWAKKGRFPNAWKTGPEGAGEWRIPEGDLLALRDGPKDDGERIRFD